MERVPENKFYPGIVATVMKGSNLKRPLKKSFLRGFSRTPRYKASEIPNGKVRVSEHQAIEEEENSSMLRQMGFFEGLSTTAPPSLPPPCFEKGERHLCMIP